MPSFNEKHNERKIWDVINYVRALGRGEAMPAGSVMGGRMYDPEYERAHHKSIIEDALAGKYNDQVQAENFMFVHVVLSAYLFENDILAGAKSVERCIPRF
jgi:hypothetical protein